VLKCSILCDLLFAFCVLLNISHSSVLVSLKHFLLCWSILHFGVYASCFVKCYVVIFFTLEVGLHTLMFLFYHLVLCNAFLSLSVLLYLGFFFLHLHVFICSFSWCFLFSCYVCKKWRIWKMKQSPKFVPWLTLLLNNNLVHPWQPKWPEWSELLWFYLFINFCWLCW
jgi:hypothetical protein